MVEKKLAVKTYEKLKAQKQKQRETATSPLEGETGVGGTSTQAGHKWQRKGERKHKKTLNSNRKRENDQGSWKSDSKNSAPCSENFSDFFQKGENSCSLTEKASTEIHESSQGSKMGYHTLGSDCQAKCKDCKATGRGLKAMAEAAAHAVKAAFAALMAGGGAVFVVLILIVGLIGGAAFLGNSQSSEVLSAEVLAHTPAIQKYASEFGIPEYVSAIQAIMMQERGGRGTDPMQASECPYNTQYPNTPGAIQDADYSIKVGIQYYADCVREAGCESPQDMDKLKLSLQGYNYGNGYISWALEKFGGYSKVNALQFSQEQAAAHGWSGYGDPEYVPHVMRYYSGGGWFTGLFGNRQLVNIAKGQLGNEGGEKFWSWYGFTSREEWCACFVSWCANQAGLIQSGAVPKFSLCTDGKNWFQNQGNGRGWEYAKSRCDRLF